MSETEEKDAASVGERRRRVWPADLKRRIIADSLKPGASASEVARRYGLNANLLFTWRRRSSARGSKAIQEPIGVLPVTVAPMEATSALASDGSGSTGRMEIVLAEGDRVIVGTDVETASLARVLRALTRR